MRLIPSSFVSPGTAVISSQVRSVSSAGTGCACRARRESSHTAPEVTERGQGRRVTIFLNPDVGSSPWWTTATSPMGSSLLGHRSTARRLVTLSALCLGSCGLPQSQALRPALGFQLGRGTDVRHKLASSVWNRECAILANTKPRSKAPVDAHTRTSLVTPNVQVHWRGISRKPAQSLSLTMQSSPSPQQEGGDFTNPQVLGAAIGMAAAVATSNYLVLFPINDWFTAGTLTYPLTFLLTDVTNRVFGKRAAQEVVFAGFCAGLPLSFLLSGPRIALASGTAYLTSQFLDVSIFNRLRNTGPWWVAPLCSTVIASAVDSTLFVTIAFIGEPLPWVTWGIGDFVVKVSMAFGMLLPFRAITLQIARAKQGRMNPLQTKMHNSPQRAGAAAGGVAAVWATWFSKLLGTEPPARVSYRPFEATAEWQRVEDDQILPPGLEIEMDVETGEKRARLPQPEPEAQDQRVQPQGPAETDRGLEKADRGTAEPEAKEGAIAEARGEQPLPGRGEPVASTAQLALVPPPAAAAPTDTQPPASSPGPSPAASSSSSASSPASPSPSSSSAPSTSRSFSSVAAHNPLPSRSAPPAHVPPPSRHTPHRSQPGLPSLHSMRLRSRSVAVSGAGARAFSASARDLQPPCRAASSPAHASATPPPSAPYIPDVRVDDFDYHLPADRIAVRPCEPRDSSRLLVCSASLPEVGGVTRLEEGWALQDAVFTDAPRLLPPNALLLLNDSRVICARLPGHKEATGGRAEVMLLAPLEPSRDPAIALNAASGTAVWQCFVGGRNVKVGDVIVCDAAAHQQPRGEAALRAEVLSKSRSEATVRLQWEGGRALAEELAAFGRVPLPPYIKRAADHDDLQTYQTAHAAHDGSVAAPTAGLHLSERLMESIREGGTEVVTVTLHVGAGTFKPVQAAEAAGHDMHSERIAVQAHELRRILQGIDDGKVLIPVGTTTVRTLESLYWWGVKLIAGEASADAPQLEVQQWDPYRLRHEMGGGAELPSGKAALEAVERWAEEAGDGAAVGYTSLMIVPGYHFVLCDMLFTNTHQPCSTLLMLVAALVGGQRRLMQIYNHALGSGYRFLSYGDSNLLQCHPASSFPRRR